MTRSVVSLVRTGTANTASVIATLERLGAQVRDVRTPEDIERASAVVLPGVGALGAGMAALRAGGLVEPLRDRVLAGRPTLCVCLGMQMLCETSDETPGERGLGVVRAHVARFPPDLRVPQMGWNTVQAGASSALVRTGAAYFANSFRLTPSPALDDDGWACATTTYGGSFVSAMERGGVLACQFHPELSGAWGRELIGRWLAGARLDATPAGEGAGAC